MNLISHSSRRILHSFAILAACAWLWPSGAQAQGVTSLGTDFWCGFMPNSFALQCCPPENVVMYIGSGTANDVHVDVYGGSSTGPVETYHAKMQPNTIWAVPAKSEQAWTDYSPEQAVNFGIHVYSTNPIVVYGYQYSGVNTSSTDSYLAIPTPALGTEYYAPCWADDHYVLGSGWYESNQPLAGQFMIISPYDNNVVTIGPVKTDTRADPIAATILHHEGDTWTVTLMKGETYLVQSSGLNFGDADLTGTHIVSSKPIALVSGHQLCSVPIGELPPAGNGSKDELLEMIPPLQAWGTSYYMMPVATRVVCGDLIRVIAGEDGETITLTSATRTSQALLNHAGDFYDFDEVTEPSILSSSGGKKFLAEDILYSAQFDGDPNGNADPSSIVLTPHEQFEKKMIFEPPDRTGVSGFIHYATFICEDDSIKHIQINGKPITFYPPAGEDVIAGTSPLMGCYRIIAPVGVPLVATCGSPFACYMYGFAQYETYGNPAGMALGIPSPDTLPPLEVHDSSCGVYNVELREPRHEPQFSFEDTKIAEFQLITDSQDLRWSKPSVNFALTPDPAHPFTPGDSTAFFTLSVIDPSQDAYGAVWTTDKAGNDTVYQYWYTAPKLAALPLPFTIQPVRVTSDSCTQISFVNTGGGPIDVANARILGIDTAGTFTVTPKTINRTLQPGDSVTLQLCFDPRDSIFSNDTLALALGADSCTILKYPVSGIGITPIIVASDVDFGNVVVGTTSAAKPVKIENVGTAPLVIDQNWKLDDNVNFTFADASSLPITIPPGGSANVNFVAQPQATGPFATVQHWGTNLPEPYAHQRKDTSQLTVIGVQAGLTWDRPKQGFWTECSNPVIDTVYLENPTSGSEGSDILVDSLGITGPDAAEFTIVGWGFQSGSPWRLAKDASVFVALQFTPDLSKQYAPRAATLTAYALSNAPPFSPSMQLTGTVRHATIRIVPSSYDYGTVKPGDSVGTTFFIHNDGDTTLVLTNLTVDGGFAVSGYTPNQQIPPGDSAPVVISLNSVPAGASIGIATAVGADTACTQLVQVPIQAHAQFYAVASSGHDFGALYVCQSGSGQVVAEDTGSMDARLVSARIVDTLDGQGASQFSFAGGSQTIQPNTVLHGGDSVHFTVNFVPVIGANGGAYVVFTWVNVATGETSTTLAPLNGSGLHYVNTLSVAGSSGGLYTAYPSQQISLPVTIVPSAGGLNFQSGIYGIRLILRFKRDMFVMNSWADGDVHVESSNVGPDPADANYVLDTVVLRSNSPITQADSMLANLPLEYVVNKDSVTSLDIIDPVYLDSAMHPACWVSHDTIPATFAGLDKCGDATLRSLLSGTAPAFKIQAITPNPVSGEANIGYSVRLDGVPLTMDVYDALGRGEASVMENKAITTGQHNATFDTRLLPAGNYILRVTDGTTVQSVPFVVQK